MTTQLHNNQYGQHKKQHGQHNNEYDQAQTPSTNTQELARKTLEDIYFLQNRIEKVKSLSTQNVSILKTYESMLKSRYSVLEWLKKQGAKIDDELVEQIRRA